MKASIGVSAGPVRVSQGLGFGGGLTGLAALGLFVMVAEHWLVILIVGGVIVGLLLLLGLVGFILDHT